MAKTEKGVMYDGVRGGKVEFGTFTLNPGSIATNTESEETLAFDGVASGDLIFVTPRQLDGYLIEKGARVTDTDEIGVTLANLSDTDAVDGAEKTYDYLVLKFNES